MEYGSSEVFGVHNSDDIDQSATGRGGLPCGFDFEAVEPEVAHDRALEELEVGDFFERDCGFGLVEDAFSDIERAFGEGATHAIEASLDEHAGNECIDDGDRDRDEKQAQYDDWAHDPVGLDFGIELGLAEDG